MSTVLVLGGAGFVGTNVAHAEASKGKKVRVFDNLSRAGVDQNLRWLRGKHGPNIQFVNGDVRDRSAAFEAVDGVSRVYHFAAQTAVTTSVDSPLEDFEVNARGTINVLEALRSLARPPTLLFTSTNKVYGNLGDLSLAELETRYQPKDGLLRNSGVSESRPLDFHSPYGCSKGCADQYVLDYARTYNLPATVFRMSCIYGPHQFGTEDQGWVAHFLIQALRGERIVLYGDGKQVRDILFVEDLVTAMLSAHDSIEQTRAEAFNIGGGPANTVSLRELLRHIETILERKVKVDYQDWRVGDQKYYVSDTSKFTSLTQWKPSVSVFDGVGRLASWLEENRVPTSPASQGRMDELEGKVALR